MLTRTFGRGLVLATSFWIVSGCSAEPRPAGTPGPGNATGGGSATTTAGGRGAQAGTTALGGTNATGSTTSSGGMASGGASTTSGGSGNPGSGGNQAGGTTARGGGSTGGLASSGVGGTLVLLGGSSASGGSAPSAGRVAAAGGSGTGGTATLTTGGTSATSGGSPSLGGIGAGGSPTPSLHGCTASIPDATLSQEYETWKSAYLASCSDTQARVQAGGNTPSSVSNETFSEGIGYGMLLAVAFDDRPNFDKLWAYYKAARNSHGLMNWKINACTGSYYEANGASDGDLDTAMALVQADRRWGGYAADANLLLDAIRTYETMACGSLTVLRPGDAWGLECTTGSLNPSYFSPGYYRAFARYQPDQSTFWTKLADDSMAMLLVYQQNAGGALMGEWAYTDRLADTSYGYNACRTPWRVAVDYVWWGTAGALTFLTNVSSYVDSSGGVANVPFDKNSALLGPFALSGIATGKCEAYYQSWMTGAVWDDRYFQGTLRVLTMALMAGKFVSFF